ncbi:TPA: 50S ribosomal protein L15 [Candidatus Saccharibacteria bacterium]|nr:MAG: ribosomal protein L15 [Candidatus Saccharibacteria bacterium GW2011_GWC2_44_17]MBH1956267.1 50S ribosomal protein L15 [Candidatus Saccharibacteria bacterium]OGL23420.1 MAG: 50S ribosomal protein L15 [Candidatus Saccharibacteria bacterium RIFCSPHIGHO2_01_FULL_46_30]OGL33968.1 MAG: 50S ribosomal protein L15 [Candidatus Saccharibacteria bacterium RIFCSPHIGHO2_12_FULL_47_16]MBH1972655.1 50S ribosomal protein L15 [Candidatus Saccharibacteria bacterium]
MTKYNELQVTANKDRKRVGRGIAAGQGKTAGRGTKGQGARTGKKLHAMFQGGSRSLVTAIPKARGFKSKRTPAQVVYLDHLNALKGKTVDNFVLFEEGYIKTPFHAVKVIARGELTEKVTLKVQGASKSVQEAVTKAGGSFEKIATPLKKSEKEAEKNDK